MFCILLFLFVLSNICNYLVNKNKKQLHGNGGIGIQFNRSTLQKTTRGPYLGPNNLYFSTKKKKVLIIYHPSLIFVVDIFVKFLTQRRF